MADNEFPQKIESTAFAFRGYNVTNLGRTPELLAHPAYGPTVERYLKRAAEICARATRRPVNLVRRVRRETETTLRTYTQAVAMVVGVELAQLKLLEEFFDVSFQQAQLSFGYSLGEVTALIAGGVYDLDAVLGPLLKLARDAGTLGRDVSMGVVFSRGPALDMAAVERLCLEISHQGNGLMGISSFLSPNTVLVLGQGRTVDRFKRRMHEYLPEAVHFRKNPHHWPPLHTRITWQKNIPNRAGLTLATIPGGFVKPTPPVLSCVTGTVGYNDYNSREIIVDWIDHPQKLWDVVDRTLAEGVERVVHVGPQPNIIPATFNRLSNNVSLQLSGRSLGSFGRRAMQRIVRRRRPWLTNLLSSDATLLRAPYVEHVVLEDWLLEQEVS